LTSFTDYFRDILLRNVAILPYTHVQTKKGTLFAPLPIMQGISWALGWHESKLYVLYRDVQDYFILK
jgi:hypothetical protein